MSCLPCFSSLSWRSCLSWDMQRGLVPAWDVVDGVGSFTELFVSLENFYSLASRQCATLVWFPSCASWCLFSSFLVAFCFVRTRLTRTTLSTPVLLVIESGEAKTKTTKTQKQLQLEQQGQHLTTFDNIWHHLTTFDDGDDNNNKISKVNNPIAQKNTIQTAIECQGMRHPNGYRSILKYSNTFCGSAEHGTMQLFGVLVLGKLASSNMVLGVTWTNSRDWVLHWQLSTFDMVVRFDHFSKGTTLVFASSLGSRRAKHPTCFDALCVARLLCVATLVPALEGAFAQLGGCRFHRFVPDSARHLLALGIGRWWLPVLFGLPWDWRVLSEPWDHRLC